MRYLLTHLIDQSAKRFPQTEAIRCRGVSLSYQELVERSNQLAHLLVERGVRRGDRVGILMNKRVECAIAIYGIMKAGAAYVPLDPRAPTERHAFVIENCDIKHLISEPRKTASVAKLATARSLTTIIGCEEDEDISGTEILSFDRLNAFEHRHGPDVAIMEQDLAYILYTSGSTGVPKGIMHSHRSGLAWAEVSANAYGLSENDRISNYAPLHFDLSTLDYFAGALAASTTVMIPEETTRFAESLCQLIAEEALTLFYTVPLALTQLATAGCVERHDLSALRWILFGGEQMPPKHLETLMKQLPATRFANVYGPTETNGCTHFVVAPDHQHTAPVPIGRPYANVEALILDGDDKPVAAGESGELVIRAATLMRGYWGRDDLNAVCSYYRKVVSGLPDRFHRTGDLVFEQPDGNLCYIGRKDRQIKSRGCRVDLDEVEAVMLRCEPVSEAAVYPVADSDGHQMIESAVIAQSGGELTEAALRNLLRQKLPNYALPVRIDIVDDLPRTSNGKVDRLKLAQLASERQENENKPAVLMEENQGN